MKYSIIIPVYNTEKYIEKCISSILEQAYEDYELIIVNDGSIDSSIEIINQLLRESDIDWVIIDKDNGGQGSARNLGIKCAKGEYLVFLDSDDYLMSTMLEAVDYVIESKHPDIVCFNSMIVDENGKIIKKYEMCGQLEGEKNINNYPEMLMFPPAIWNKIVRRDFFYKVGCYFEEGIIYEDTVVSRALMAEASNIYFMEDALYYYVQRNQSTMGKSLQNDVNSKIMDIVKANESLLMWFKQKELFNRFYYEIESISVSNILFYALDIINMNNKSDKRQDILADFISVNFQKFSTNKYLSDLERKKIELLLNHQYASYYRRFALKKKLKRKLKTMLEVLK